MAKIGIKKQIARFTRRLRDPDAARPVFSQSMSSLSGSAAARLTTVEAELKRLSEGWRQHIPQILDTVGIARDEARSANQIHDRFDALRLDMDRLAERVDLNLEDLKSHVGSGPAIRHVEVVNPNRLSNSVATGLKLHFLRSDPALAGFVNISEKASAGVDVIAAPSARLPLPQGQATEIEVAAGYGVSASTAARQLGDWLTLLAPGGVLRVQRLDLTAALDAVARGALEPRKLAAAIAASDGAILSDTVTPDALRDIAKSAGFTAVRLTRDKTGMASLRAARAKIPGA